MLYVPGVTSRFERLPGVGTGAGVTLSASTHGVRMLHEHESEQENLPAPPYDPIAERLLRARTIIISGEITQRLPTTVSSQLLARAADSDADITVFITSQGGHVEAGDTIHDLLRF